MDRFRAIDWAAVRRDGHNIFMKLIRTRNPRDVQGPDDTAIPTRTRLSRCLTTMDLISLGVGSCVGTGMYLVTGMVARNIAGPGVAISFMIAAIASIFSGACFAEFGVRVPNTTGSAYTYSYVTVGEFLAFIIGWNMVLEYMIGTSACARALSACFDSLFEGSISNYVASKLGTILGKPPDIVAAVIALLMTALLVTGLRKSLVFTNVLNAINLMTWMFMMGSSLFYVNAKNWSEHRGFLPYGWTGVLNGAATCFYAFIGFDIIATTGEEAINPRRSIPLAIVLSLVVILVAYVSTSIILTLMVPYNEVNTNSPLMNMFSYVHAPSCKYIVAVGALAGLTVSMFGSMFPLPRVVYAMSLDGLLHSKLANVSTRTGVPTYATIVGGISASVISLFVQLEVLVEMMSIGTLLAYTLVSTCVLILRYQPHSTNLVELLPEHIRTQMDPEGMATGHHDSNIAGFRQTHVMQSGQRVMIRRVTRSSPDSDDTLPGDESDDYGRDDAYLLNTNSDNEFYAIRTGCTVSPSRLTRFYNYICRRINEISYLCPGFLPWVERGPATEESGLFVIKAVGVLYGLIVLFNVLAVYGTPSECNWTAGIMIILFLAIVVVLLAVSRKPENRSNLIYATPGLPFVPTIAILSNIYLILNLSVLTLIRFTVWMIVGLFVYFKYGIKNSTLEKNPPMPRTPTPPMTNTLDRTTIPTANTQSLTTGDRNIFEGDGNGMFGNQDQLQFVDTILTWHEPTLETAQSTSRVHGRMQVETRYDERTNSISSHTSYPRPPWAYPDAEYDNWD